MMLSETGRPQWAEPVRWTENACPDVVLRQLPQNAASPERTRRRSKNARRSQVASARSVRSASVPNRGGAVARSIVGH